MYICVHRPAHILQLLPPLCVCECVLGGFWCFFFAGWAAVSGTSLSGVPKLNIIKAQINVFNSQKLCHLDYGHRDPRTTRNRRRRRLLAREVFHFFPLRFFPLHFFLLLAAFPAFPAVRTFCVIPKFLGASSDAVAEAGAPCSSCLLAAGCFFPESFMRLKLKYFHRALHTLTI